MVPIVTVFQLEIRYNHILNFSQISRKIIAPYVKLAENLKIDNQNTVEERIILNFEKDNYIIIIGWDRILIKGQENTDMFTAKNSPFQLPFLDILNKLKNLPEFGSIKNILFAINYINKVNFSKEKLVEKFMEKSITPETSHLMEGINDIAISLENKNNGNETYLTYGPYFGTEEISKRQIVPVKIENLGDTEFIGIMAEYKRLITANDFTLQDFTNTVLDSKKLTNKLWKLF
jgi:hypothetical protein